MKINLLCDGGFSTVKGLEFPLVVEAVACFGKVGAVCVDNKNLLTVGFNSLNVTSVTHFYKGEFEVIED